MQWRISYAVYIVSREYRFWFMRDLCEKQCLVLRSSHTYQGSYRILYEDQQNFKHLNVVLCIVTYNSIFWDLLFQMSSWTMRTTLWSPSSANDNMIFCHGKIFKFGQGQCISRAHYGAVQNVKKLPTSVISWMQNKASELETPFALFSGFRNVFKSVPKRS